MAPHLQRACLANLTNWAWFPSPMVEVENLLPRVTFWWPHLCALLTHGHTSKISEMANLISTVIKPLSHYTPSPFYPEGKVLAHKLKMVSDNENIQMCSLKFSLAKCYFPIPGARALNSYSNETNNLQVKDVTSNYTYNPRFSVYFIKPYSRSRFLHSRKV